ncbi:response regulator [Nostocoides sp. HKS02]|uniref:hybrid sensor histidine kinase/response regulator n=1 Tax=Nostocoides sp. HKS02 TaxID=1813880 RepID=UPI0018A825C8|nr:response regulator [Tetrasphaera sp. HKS02]
MKRPPEQERAEPTGGIALRRGLLLAAVVAVVLPLLVVATALTGFTEVQRSHGNALRLLTAQRYQQDADMLHDAIYADVLAAVLNSGADGGVPALDESVDVHVAQLDRDLVRLDPVDTPASLAADIDRLRPTLRAYGAQAVALVDLMRTDPTAARAKLPSFESAYRALEKPQADLTVSLAREAAVQTAAADSRQTQAVASTTAAAAAVLVAMLLLAFFLYRLVTGNEVLLHRLEDNAEQLAHSNDELRDAQQMAHIGSWQWSPHLGVAQWSDEFYRILGLAPGTAGDHEALFAARVHPEDMPDVLRDRHEVARSLADVYSHYRIVRPDGNVREVVALGKAVRDDQGEIVRLVGTLQDVTEQRELERLKDEFVGVISHELRTPLTSIRGALGLIAGGAVGTLPPKAQRMADVALNSCQRLVRLVNDILDVEKMAAGKLELDLAPLPAAEVVADAIAEMKAMADQANVTIAAMPIDAVVLADRDRVAQALTNLISNAVKFSPAGGTVLVAVGPSDSKDPNASKEFVQFTVTDEGSGIPADQLEAIFDRFTQADASDTRAKGGTGLGLPICRGIVEQHGGRIWATSEPGQGSTFAFTLPAAPAPGEEMDAGPLPIGAVLVCDDDPDVVEVLGAMLESHGYSTLRAHSGPEALALAADQAPSVVLMDLRMPGMTGWETIAALRADPVTAEIPIIILSALAPDDMAVPAASSWLTKPVDQRALMASLRRALGTGPTTSVLVVEDDEDLGDVLQAFFTDHGVHARIARTGAQALAMSREVPPDLLVLDLGLPDIDGYAVVEAMRRDDRLRSLPLLVYTGSQLTSADRHRLLLGETRFVTKSGESSADFARKVISLLRKVTADS